MRSRPRSATTPSGCRSWRPGPGAVSSASLATLAYRSATPVVGDGERAVRQRFELCMDIPDHHPVRALAAALDELLDKALCSNPALWDGPPLHFNDLIVQRYEPGKTGITPHRDHIRYAGLVAVVVLSGTGRFCICSDRSGAHAREIPCPPGGVILMRAPGLAGTTGRPFHFVQDISRRRYTIGLRHDTRAAEPRGTD